MKLLRSAGVSPDGRSPRSTRHTWAALSIASGLGSFLVMESAGHSNLSTTLGYARCASFYRDAVKGWEKGEFRMRQSPSSAMGTGTIS
jgi:integrase